MSTRVCQMVRTLRSKPQTLHVALALTIVAPLAQSRTACRSGPAPPRRRGRSSCRASSAPHSSPPSAEPTAALPEGATAYYVDCTAGSDSHSGRSPAEAWRTLSRASRAPLQPGDRLLLKRGCTWAGSLLIRSSGTAAANIVVGTYGSGEQPTIVNTSDPAAQNLVVVSGSYVTITDLATRATPARYEAGCRNAGIGYRVGFRLDDSAHHVTLHRVTARGHNHAVLIRTGAHHNRVLESRFIDNMLMTDVHDGAVGIDVWGDDNEIAYNTISGSHGCSYSYGVDGSAIEVYGGRCNNVHHNVAIDNQTFTELGHLL
jgi:hypothetical protein